MSYQFNTDAVLSETVVRVINSGRRAEVYKLASQVVVLNKHLLRAFEVVHEAAQALGNPFPMIWAVDVSTTGKYPLKNKNLLFFIKSPDEIIQKLNTIDARKHVNTPKSVLIKMARTRINKLRRDILKHNAQVQEAYYQKVGYTAIQLFDVETVADLDKLCTMFVNSMGTHNRVPPEAVQAYKHDLRDKKLFDDEVVKEAWKYVMISEIHHA